MKRILIIKPSSMGDIIHGLLVAESMATQLEEVAIDWVVRKEFAPLVEAASLVNRSFIFERKGGVRAFIRLINEIREVEYDWVLDMQGLARSGLLTCASRASLKVGRSDAREGAGLFYQKKTAPLPSDRPTHAVRVLAGFLDVLNLSPELPPSIRFEPPETLVDLPDVMDAKRIVIFPESRRAEKNWQGFEALTHDLLETTNQQVVWCGHLACNPERAIESSRFINLTGKTQIDQLAAILHQADVVLSNDSGPMHLAAALGRPLVALFGPTDPALFGPFPEVADRQRVIRRADGAMNTITVEEVRASLVEVLEAHL